MTATGLGPNRPFPGLRPYERPDHGWFFGREEQSFALYRLLDGGRLVAVVGGSGSGKSSVVRAGLLPLLDEETAGEGGRKWRWWQMRPGDTPIARLARALAGEPAEDADATTRAVHGSRLERLHFLLRKSSFGFVDSLREIGAADDVTPLVLVDQFEELFRFTDLPGSDVDRAARREEAALFVQLLLEAERSDGPAVRIVLTMRSDYLGDCARFQGLPEAVTVSQFLVPSLSRDQREEAIRGPIEKAGGSIDDALVERLLDDSGEELDQLPVLAHGLMRLWHAAENSRSWSHGNSRRLTRSAYEAIGGLTGALSVHADALLAEPEMASRLLVIEQVFRALSEVDRGRGVRRPLPFARLLAETGVYETDLRIVLDRLRREDCSFLVPSHPQRIEASTVIDIAHEALIRRWTRMSARPSGLTAQLEGHDQESLGWLWAEAEDGNTYRALLNLIGGAIGDKRATLPLDQVEERWGWWTTRKRTPAWAERYADEPGGHLKAVRRLFTDSRAALKAERRRRDQERRLTEEYERLKLEQAEERARKEELQRRALEEQLAAAAAQQRAEAAFAEVLEQLVIWDLHGVASLLSVLSESDRRTAPLPIEILSERTGIAADRLRALGERISCRGKFLRVRKKPAALGFADAAAAQVARNWYALYRDNKPFGCLVDLRNRYVIPLYGGGALIGRGFQKNLRDRVVSRAHLALLRPDGGGGALALELRSVNGTTINGRPLVYGQETTLTSGDVVALGNVAPLLFVGVDEFARLVGLDDLSPTMGALGVPTAHMVEGIWGILIDEMRLPPTLLRGRAVLVQSDGSITEMDDSPEQHHIVMRVGPLGDVGVEVHFDKGVEDAKLLCPMRDRDDYGIVDLELQTSYVVPRDRLAPSSSEGAKRIPGRFLINNRFFEVIACGTAVAWSGNGSERHPH